MAETKLGMELSKCLFTHEPELLVCDLVASARAAAAVSNLLGCIMATVLVKNGEAAYLTAMRAVMQNVNKSATATANKAIVLTPNMTPQ